MRHNAKAKWLEVAAVMAAAHKYELKHGFKMRWYLCDECSYYHVATQTYNGRRVISLEAIQEKQKAGDVPQPSATKQEGERQSQPLLNHTPLEGTHGDR